MYVCLFVCLYVYVFVCMYELRHGPRGASHEKFHAAPSKKQARFLEGPLSLRTQGKSDLLRSPFASKKVLRGTFRGLPPFAPLLCMHVCMYVCMSVCLLLLALLPGP